MPLHRRALLGAAAALPVTTLGRAVRGASILVH